MIIENIGGSNSDSPPVDGLSAHKIKKLPFKSKGSLFGF